jgi:hypothetical protein
LLPEKIFAREGEEYAVKAAFVLNFSKYPKRFKQPVILDTPKEGNKCIKK